MEALVTEPEMTLAQRLKSSPSSEFAMQLKLLVLVSWNYCLVAKTAFGH